MKEVFKKRLAELIEEGHKLVNAIPSIDKIDARNLDYNNYVLCHTWTTSCLNLLRSFFGETSPFYKDFKKAADTSWKQKVSNSEYQIDYAKENIAKGYALLLSLRIEVERGLIMDAKQLYESYLFSNLLEQAFELAGKGYLVGSAVYGRLIIENFINDLCRVKSVIIDAGDRLPQKLTKLRDKSVIDLPLERVIQASYDVGTYAIHGKEEFKKYSKDEIIDHLKIIRDKILIIK